MWLKFTKQFIKQRCSIASLLLDVMHAVDDENNQEKVASSSLSQHLTS